MAAILVVIAVIIFIIFIIWIICTSSSSSSSNSSKKTSAPSKPVSSKSTYKPSAAPTHIKRTPITKQNFHQNLTKLTDREDVHFQATRETQEFITVARSYSASPRKAFRRTSASAPQISINMSWADNLSELLQQTDQLYSNVMLTCGKKLASERFQYYNRLYFRSFTAADLCHAKGQEIQLCLNNEIDPLFKRLNNPKDPAHLQKSDYNQLCAIAKNMRSIKKFLFNRRDQLNQQTAVIRHKIGSECGAGGKAWEQRILASKGEF